MPPVDITVNVTDAATFTCAAAGVPLPFISWTLPNGTQISLDSTSDGSPIFVLTDISDESPIVVVSMLIIESVVPGDAGEYTCTAVNPRDTVSETATLTVQGEDSKNVSKSVGNLSPNPPMYNRKLSPVQFFTKKNPCNSFFALLIFLGY